MHRAWPEEVETEDWPGGGAWAKSGKWSLRRGWLGERTGSSQISLRTEACMGAAAGGRGPAEGGVAKEEGELKRR